MGTPVEDFIMVFRGKIKERQIIITTKDIFNVVLDDHERECIYKELCLILPQMTNDSSKKFARLYKLRAALRQGEEDD